MKPTANHTQNRLGTENIGKLLLTYSLPAIIGTMVSSLYNVIDRIFIGQGVGPLAISGLALTFPFMNLLFAFGMLIGVGTATHVSISLGENDTEKANRIIANALIMNFVIIGTVVLLSRIFMTKILMFFGGSENTIGYAEDFMSIIIPSMLIATVNYGFNNVMRASGYPHKAMYTMFISAVVNVILAPVFIFVFGWGIRGAALATTIAMSVSCIWVISHFLNPKSAVRFQKKYFVFDKEVLKSILGIGLSPFFMQIAMSVIVILMNRALIEQGGDLAIGALGIQHSIISLIIMFIVGLNQGAQPILGFNFGAGKYDRMRETLKLTAIAATAISIFGFVLGTFFPHSLARLFTKDDQLIELAATAMRISVLIFPLVGSQIVITTFFQSIGKAKISIFLSLTRQVLFLIPCLLLLPPRYGINGVWASMPVSDLLAVIVTTTTLIIFLKKFRETGQSPRAAKI